MASLVHPLLDSMCFSYELWALKLYVDVERYLENGFAKKEEKGYEPMETLSAAVPHCLCSITHSVSHVHDLDPLSYKDHSLGVSLSHLYSLI
jgi:hypothetical protein